MSQAQYDALQRDFYPRPHVEGDKIGRDMIQDLNISTHALTWRATIQCDPVEFYIAIFLPTPSRGGRPPTGGHLIVV